MNVKVKIAEREYPFTINGEDEEFQVRHAAKLINERLLVYRQKFSDRDMQDFLALTALQLVVKYIKLEAFDLKDLTGRLDEMNRQVEDFLTQ